MVVLRDGGFRGAVPQDPPPPRRREFAGFVRVERQQNRRGAEQARCPDRAQAHPRTEHRHGRHEVARRLPDRQLVKDPLDEQRRPAGLHTVDPARRETGARDCDVLRLARRAANQNRPEHATHGNRDCDSARKPDRSARPHPGRPGFTAIHGVQTEPRRADRVAREPPLQQVVSRTHVVPVPKPRHRRVHELLRGDLPLLARRAWRLRRRWSDRSDRAQRHAESPPRFRRADPVSLHHIAEDAAAAPAAATPP